MSAVADLTRVLIDRGMDPAEAAALVARAGAELAAPTRSKAAERTARWREKQASQTVTERHAVTVPEANDKPSPSVTERHKASHGDGVLSLREEKKEEKEVKRERRAQQLGDGWRPQPPDWQSAVEQFGEEGAETELQKFTDHARTNGRTAKDWNAAWRNWCRRAVEYRGGRNGQRTNHAQRGRSGADDFFAGLEAVAANLDRDGAVARPADTPIPRGRFEIDGSGTP